MTERPRCLVEGPTFSRRVPTRVRGEGAVGSQYLRLDRARGVDVAVAGLRSGGKHTMAVLPNQE